MCVENIKSRIYDSMKNINRGRYDSSECYIDDFRAGRIRIYFTAENVISISELK